MSPLQRFIDALNQELFHVGDWKFSIVSVIRIIVLPLLAFLFAKYFRRGLRKLLRKAHHLDPGLRGALEAISYYVILVIGLIIAMDQIGVDVTSLAVFTGAVGVGIGLGLQDFAKNFIAGLLMMGTRPVKPGDRVEFAGLSGRVRTIGSYSTVLETADRAGLLVPNSSLLNDRIINRSYFEAADSVAVTLRLPLSTDLDATLAELRKQYAGVESFQAQVTAVTETAVEVRLTVPWDGRQSIADATDDAYRRLLLTLARK